MSIEGTLSHGLLSLASASMEDNDFDSLRISLASPEKIRSWSYGEVKKPETINYRTFKPERDGLFCARIFGPMKDFECLCGKYKRIKYKGTICEKCGVEVTSSKVRRERMGHIELVCPVAHIWFLRSLPSKMSILMGIPLKSLEKVIYFEQYMVTDAKMTELEEGMILTEEEYQEKVEEYGEGAFVAKMGAEAVREVLANMDLPSLKNALRKEIAETKSSMKKDKLVKRLKLVENFIDSHNRPEWMVLEVLPVIPPDIRPLIMLDGGRFAASDLNELYRRVINRNNRLRDLMELDAPDIIIRNEKRMLQESVDALLDNGRAGVLARNSNKKPFKSLSDMLKGKQGRFRQNLLGKRVDYSGRSVIVVGPELKLNQCGLPKKMALELFKPFIYSKLELYGLSPSIRISKKMVDSQRPEVWDLLEEVIREHPVLLNRAPTLHRLSIQAFEPILTGGKAIQLHPLVCAAFNADFDGDQMAVHIPLSIEAQVESRVLMMSTNNILSPAHGRPLIIPSKDIVLGLYYLSMVNEDFETAEPTRIVADAGEMEIALTYGGLDLHDKIIFHYEYQDADGTTQHAKVATTAGRIKIFETLPDKMRNTFEYVNKVFCQKDVANLINIVYRICGQKETVKFCDKVMGLGFKYCALCGISLGKDDIIIPEHKKAEIDRSMQRVKQLNQQYREGLITDGERYNKTINEWGRCTDEMSTEVMNLISKEKNPLKMNSLFMMADSGARGSASQIKQLAAMRGLMSTVTGEIIETPITSNFKEGLNVLEYFVSAHGSRKGLIDTALRTASAGYLTRRLVDVAQSCIIFEEDCGYDGPGLLIEPTIEDGAVIKTLAEKILGRVAAQDIINPKTKEIIVKKNQAINEAECKAITECGIEAVHTRSPLLCKCKEGICAKCYGRDLSCGIQVSVGEAVGVIAAQSLGEPGTQLTMNTKHTGGTTTGGREQSSIEADSAGIISFNEKDMVVDRNGQFINIKRNTELELLDASGKKILQKYRLPYGSVIGFANKGSVNKGDVLAKWDPYNTTIVAEKNGKIVYNELIENVSIREKFDEDTGISTKVVIDWRRYGKGELRPSLIIAEDIEKVDYEKEKQYPLAIGAIVNVYADEEVKAGDILAKIPKESAKNKDITGGLTRVSELFEARRPKNGAVISDIDGIVHFGKDYRTKMSITIEPINDHDEAVEYIIHKDKHLFVADGDRVKKGDILIEGSPVPHDLLRVLGVEAFANYTMREVQKIYLAQGVKIDNKHLEIILRMALRQVKVTDPGETTLLKTECISRNELERINEKSISEGLKPATAEPVLLGITKAALQTDSFISAASFQETVRVLTEAAVEGRSDSLVGLKENIIVGRLISAGTGLMARKLKQTYLKKKQEQTEQ